MQGYECMPVAVLCACVHAFCPNFEYCKSIHCVQIYACMFWSCVARPSLWCHCSLIVATFPSFGLATQDVMCVYA